MTAEHLHTQHKYQIVDKDESYIVTVGLYPGLHPQFFVVDSNGGMIDRKHPKYDEIVNAVPYKG